MAHSELRHQNSYFLLALSVSCRVLGRPHESWRFQSVARVSKSSTMLNFHLAFNSSFGSGIAAQLAVFALDSPAPCKQGMVVCTRNPSPLD